MDQIRFENDKVRSRKKKDLILIIFVSTLTLSTLFYFFYTTDNPSIPSNIPRFNIVCNNRINKHNYKDCVIDVDYDSTVAQIKFRGKGNLRYPKKEYRVQLSMRKSLLDMRKDDDWILFAMYIDYPHMRIKLSLDLWRRLESSNPTAILPDSEYVNLFLNSEYKGLYLLAEKFDRRLLGFDDAKNNIDSSLIFQAKPYSTFHNYDNEIWQQDWPNEDDNIFIMEEILRDLFFFINNTSDEEFFDTNTGIYSKFDKLNLMDFYIYNFFILHIDFWYTNYYLVRNTNPNKFFLIPWDFDGSFGQWADELYSPYYDPSPAIHQNALFERLINNDEFMQDCKNRWFDLREKLWTDSYIIDKVFDIYEEIKQTLEISWDIWKPNLDYMEYVEYLFDWIPERLEFCDTYFSNIYS